MQKQVYATADEAQAMADYRVSLMGRPLWVYATEGGYSLTSKGHHLHHSPAAMISADDYAQGRPQTQEQRDPTAHPTKVYRVLYSHKGNCFVQFFHDVDPKILGLLLNQPGVCLLINVSDRMVGLHVTNLINRLRQHADCYVWYSFIYQRTLMVTNGATLHEAKRPHYNADYIHAAMTARNNEVVHDQ